MATGVKVDNSCISAFNDLKMTSKYGYIIFNINGEQIEVERTGDKGAAWSDFSSSLPQDECRFCVFDYHFKVGDGERNKLVFITWAPETSKIKSKMIYAASADVLKKSLVGIAKFMQATDSQEIDESAVADLFSGTK